MISFDWYYAIKERNEWLELYSTDPGQQEVISYLKRMTHESMIADNKASAKLVLEAYDLYETLSDEEKVTVTLMGW